VEVDEVFFGVAYDDVNESVLREAGLTSKLRGAESAEGIWR
jgi:hypothetical protein